MLNLKHQALAELHLLSPQQAKAKREAWASLQTRGLMPMGAAAPEAMLPQLTNLQGGQLLCLTVDGAMQLALPVRPRGFPLRVLESWVTPLHAAGTPLIAGSGRDEIFADFLSQLKTPLLLKAIETSGPFWDVLRRSGARIHEFERWKRASLTINQTFENWMATNFAHKRRKEYRRLLNRLSEQGRLVQQSYTPGEPLEPWVEALLSVEGSGWKAERGTALAADGARAQAARDMLQGLAASEKLRLWVFRLDGKPIAAMHGVVEGDQAWLGKIGYDESFAKYSPGVLLLLYATEQLMAEQGLARADSCAIPDHPMIDNIWRDRTDFVDVLVAPKHFSPTQFHTIAGLERLRRAARALTKDSYNYLRGRNKS